MFDPTLLIDFFKEHQVLVLIIGMMIGGESVLIPAVYLVVTGFISAPFFIGVALAAGMVSDSAWYGVGRMLPQERISRFGFMRRNQFLIDRLNGFFDQHALRILYGSKFVYGSRVVTQVLCGARKVHYPRYILVDLLGLVSWLLTLLAIGFSVQNSVGAFAHGVYALQIGFGVFLVIAVIVQFAARAYIRKKL